MIILAMEINLYLPFAQSLKDKRAIRQSLISKLKRNFSLSVRETGSQDDIGSLLVSAAFVCLSETEGRNYIQSIQDYIDEFTLNHSCELRSFEWDLLYE